MWHYNSVSESGPYVQIHQQRRQPHWLVLGLLICLLAGSSQATANTKKNTDLPYDIQAAWLELQPLLSSPDRDRITSELRKFRKVLDDHAASTISVLADAFWGRLRSAREPNITKHVVFLSNHSTSIGPDDPRIHSSRINSVLKHDLSHWNQIPLESIEFLQKSLARFPERQQLKSVVYSVLILAVLAAGLLLLLISLITAIPLVHHRLRHLRAYRFPKFLLTTLLLGLIVFGGSKGLGLLIPTLLLLIPMYSILQPSYRRAILLIIFLFCFCPILGKQIWNDIAFRSSPLVDVLRCESGPCQPHVAELEFADRQDSTSRAEVLYALGLHTTRIGDLNKAEKYLHEAERTGLKDAALHIALGNIALLRTQAFCHMDHFDQIQQDAIVPLLKQANHQYRIALSLSPDDAATHYNLAIVYATLGVQPKAEKHYQRFFNYSDGNVPPTQNKAEELRAFRGCTGTDRPSSSKMAWGQLSEHSLESATIRIRTARFPALWLPFHSIFFGRLTPAILQWLLVLFTILFLTLHFMAGRLNLASRCIECNGPYCPECNDTSRTSPLCPNCLMERLQITLQAPRDLWIQQVNRERHHKQKSQITFLSALVVPGLGHMIGNNPTRGWLLCCATLFAIGFLLGPFGYLTGWSLQYGPDQPVSLLTTMILTPICYIIGWLTALQFRSGA